LAQADISNPYYYTPADANGHDFEIYGVNGICPDAVSNLIAQSDADCGGSPPGEAAPGDGGMATGIHWTDAVTVDWPIEPSATDYYLYRGVLADLPGVMDATLDSCMRYDGPDLTCPEADDPTSVAGRFYFYVVVAYNGFGPGPAGNATAGPREMNDTGVCP